MEGLARAKGALSHHAAFKVDLRLLSEKSIEAGHERALSRVKPSCGTGQLH